MLRGAHGRFTLHFGLPITKMVVESGLVSALPCLSARGEGKQNSCVLERLTRGYDTRYKPAEALPRLFRQISPLSPDLFVADNTLEFELRRPVCRRLLR